MDKWRKFWRLDRRERRVLVQAAALIPLASLGLHTLGLQRLMHFLIKPDGSAVHTDADVAIDQARRLAYLIHSAGNPIRATCLERSVVLWWLLRCQHSECQIVLGARKEHGKMQAHAWVEVAGTAVNDRADIREVFASFEPL
jgi:hypothetical protein